jgi:hypothetical protein
MSQNQNRYRCPVHESIVIRKAHTINHIPRASEFYKRQTDSLSNRSRRKNIHSNRLGISFMIRYNKYNFKTQDGKERAE